MVCVTLMTALVQVLFNCNSSLHMHKLNALSYPYDYTSGEVVFHCTSSLYVYIVWRICPMIELLSHRNLETRTQQQNYECL
jgi:hypothetical protein